MRRRAPTAPQASRPSRVLIVLLIAALVPTVAATAGAAEPEEALVTIEIKSRAFEPATVTLRKGQKTRLVLHNQDAELHAFVPVGLFTGVNFNLGGNGAPEFGPEGFKRVIIPSGGRAEFRFVPERPGTYPFFCDMPGHEMKATIVVGQMEP